MSKNELRKNMLKTLQNLSAEEREGIEKALAQRLIESPIWKEAKSIGITLSEFPEWNTREIIEHAWKDGKAVSAPRTFPKTKQMIFCQFTSFEQFERSTYGIQEPLPERTNPVSPEDIDCLIVPGVIYTEAGYRIGFGGGYYDRYLQHYPNQTVSLCSEKQLVDAFEIESHDVPIQQLITEKRLIQVERT